MMVSAAAMGQRGLCVTIHIIWAAEGNVNNELATWLGREWQKNNVSPSPVASTTWPCMVHLLGQHQLLRGIAPATTWRDSALLHPYPTPSSLVQYERNPRRTDGGLCGR